MIPVKGRSNGVRGTFGGVPEPVKYLPALVRSMKYPVCGRDPGLNPFSICQYCGNALQQPEEEMADNADVRTKMAYTSN